MKQLLKRELAEDFAQVLSAVTRLQDISAEFDEGRRFTDEMKVRLALVERDVGNIQHKYDILIGAPLSNSDEVTNLDSMALRMNMAPVDQHLYALSGVASVYIDRQRLRLALQDNPDDGQAERRSIEREDSGNETRIRQAPRKQPARAVPRRVAALARRDGLVGAAPISAEPVGDLGRCVAISGHRACRQPHARLEIHAELVETRWGSPKTRA